MINTRILKINSEIAKDKPGTVLADTLYLHWMDVRDKAELQRVGEVGAKAMGGGYKVGPAAQVNYEASGASDDWAKGAAGIKYSFTVELPDTGRWVLHCTHCTRVYTLYTCDTCLPRYNFLLPPSRISGTVTAASRAVRAMAASLATSPRSSAS